MRGFPRLERIQFRKIHQVRRERVLLVSCCNFSNVLHFLPVFVPKSKETNSRLYIFRSSTRSLNSICATNQISNSTSERVDRSSEQIRLENRGRRGREKEREKIDAGAEAESHKEPLQKRRLYRVVARFSARIEADKRSTERITSPFVASRATVLLLIPPPPRSTI